MLIFVIVKCNNLNKTFFEDVIPTINVDRHVREKYGNTAKWRKVSEVNFVKGNAYVGMNAKAFKTNLTETFGLRDVSEVKAEAEAKTEDKADAEADAAHNQALELLVALKDMVKICDLQREENTRLIDILCCFDYPNYDKAKAAKDVVDQLKAINKQLEERKKRATQLAEELDFVIKFESFLNHFKS